VSSHFLHLKVLLLGESGVGKSSLLQRFVADRFAESQPATIGVDFATKVLEVYDHRVKLTIWDTAGGQVVAG
jgi:Ras-related protein Rab-18